MPTFPPHRAATLLTLLALVGAACSDAQETGPAPPPPGATGGGGGVAFNGPGNPFPNAYVPDASTPDAHPDAEAPAATPDSGPGPDLEWLDATSGAKDGQSGLFTEVGQACGIGAVKGVLCAPDQQTYIGEATVYIDSVGCDGQPFHVETTADALGAFDLPAVPAGEHEMVAIKGSWSRKYVIFVQSGKTSDLSGAAYKECFSAPPPCAHGAVQGVVCFADGSPAAGAAVTISGENCDGTGSGMSTFTDATGSYTLPTVPAGTHTVQITQGANNHAYTVEVVAGQTTNVETLGDLELCFPPVPCDTGGVTGQLCPPFGAQGIGVTTVSVTTKDCNGDDFTGTTYTSADGTFALAGLPVGNHTLVISSAGYNASFPIFAPPGGVTDMGLVGQEACPPPPAVCPTGTVTGQTCPPGGELGIGTTVVSVNTIDCNGVTANPNTSTNADGSFTLTGVPSGLQFIQISAPGYTNSLPTFVPESGSVSLGTFGLEACEPDVCGYGGVQGCVCVPSETATLSNATITLTGTGCDGVPVQQTATSDAQGCYFFSNVAEGSYLVHIDKGKFSGDFNVVVSEGQITDANSELGEEACLDPDAVDVAVVGGNWDSIEELLGNLGVPYDFYGDGGTLLSSLSVMCEYDIIFFNCGASHGWVASDPSAIANLQAYVQSCGSIYASDWAFTYDEFPWPAAIDFYGNEEGGGSPKAGDQGSFTASVIDGALAAWLGKSSVSIAYDLGAWVVVQAVAPGTETLISGSIQANGAPLANVPLMVKHQPYGDHTVLFTTFHNEAQATQDMLDILSYIIFEL